MNGIEAYKRGSVQTSPEKLLMMLFDGLIRFSKFSKQTMQEGKYEEAHNWILRAQSILVELMTTLNRKHAPELCDNLYGLYDFMYRELIDANMKKDASLIDNVIQLAMDLRNSFSEASKIVANK